METGSSALLLTAPLWSYCTSLNQGPGLDVFLSTPGCLSTSAALFQVTAPQTSGLLCASELLPGCYYG